MKQFVPMSQGWLFSRYVPEDITQMPEDCSQVNLPHLWSAKAYKGKCIYRKDINIPEDRNGIRLFLEFKGVSNECLVYINNKCVGMHKGGFTAFRVEITNAVTFGQKNKIVIIVDNSDYSTMCRLIPSAEIFGGIWGDINLIVACGTHFSLDDGGSDGIYVNTSLNDGVGKVSVFAGVSNPVNYDVVSITLYDAAGGKIDTAAVPPKNANVVFEIDNPVLWKPQQGRTYMYRLNAKLIRDGVVLDEQNVNFAFRKISAEADGIYINGRKINIKGVTRLQSKIFTEKQSVKDINNILSLGANAVRMMNCYQTERFFKMCDKKGIMLWCELPFDLDSVNEESAKNLEEQYLEFAKQYYNHPSVCFIGIDGGSTPEGKALEANIYKKLSSFDPNRLYVSPDIINNTDNDLPLPKGADICSCKVVDSNDCFNNFTAVIDAFHIANPDMPLFVSEIGTDGDSNLHSSEPVYGDSTEEYQAVFHENLDNVLTRRDFISAYFVNTLYDRADNLNGLITSDGKIKKDAFWFYKSIWSNEKFVKITGERYSKRTDKKISVKVYTNCKTVSLVLNDKPVKQIPQIIGKNIFIFDDIKLVKGVNSIEARSDGDVRDRIEITRCKPTDLTYSRQED